MKILLPNGHEFVCSGNEGINLINGIVSALGFRLAYTDGTYVVHPANAPIAQTIRILSAPTPHLLKRQAT